MIYHSKKIDALHVARLASPCRVARGDCCKTRNTQYAIRNANKPGFSLIETVTALMILALISSSVLVVIDRCTVAAADSMLRIQAFEVARDNMEALLSQSSVSEMAEYGTSEKYPAVEWQTTVEAFYEPLTERMWIQAVCSAEYTDSAGEQQTVQLTHWLTDLTKEQLLEMLQQMQQQLDEDQLIDSIEDAAEYTGVDVETIEQWVENGMLQTDNGDFIKDQLDLYKKTGGKPTADDRMRLLKPGADLIKPDDKTAPQPDDKTAPQPDETTKPKTDQVPSKNPFGLPDDYPNWPISKIFEWLQSQGAL